ncbi:MAG: hypothetical protein L3J28_05020 [Candidatus Polarisedimenticolaceae bacterium]|nr:hypothetical protein [Candidatus Polarisedimenticolaceae bacterium]
MIEINSIIIMAMGEVLLVLLIIIVVMVVLAMKRNAKDQAAAEALIKQLKKDRSARDEKVRCMLNGKYHYEDSVLDSTVRKFSKSERHFYQRFIKIYLNRDHEKLSKLATDFDAVTDPFFNLELPASTSNKEQAPAENNEFARLKEANDKLKEELSVSMSTLGRMLSEYANVLDEDARQEAAAEDGSKEASISSVLMGTLAENSTQDDADVDVSTESPVTDELLELSEEEPSDGSDVDISTESPVADELLEPSEEEPSDGSDLDVSTEAPVADELLEIQEEAPTEEAPVAVPEEKENLSTDAVDDLLDSINVPIEEKSDSDDELSKDLLDDLDKVANEIDEMVIDAPKEVSESEVDDIDALLAESAATEIAIEAPKEESESSDPDDILEELQKAQDLGQEIENLIDMTDDASADEPSKD